MSHIHDEKNPSVIVFLDNPQSLQSSPFGVPCTCWARSMYLNRSSLSAVSTFLRRRVGDNGIERG